MSLETILLWGFVGLVAGWLASAVVGGGFGVLGDIMVGIAGSFLGGFIFRELGYATPFKGVPGTICVAFVGALVLLLAFRLVRRHRSWR